jgi:hypothetical protein
MTSDETTPDWVPAREAVNRISAACGGDLAAKAIIADRLRDGIMRTHADKLVVTTWMPDILGRNLRLQDRGAGTRHPEELDFEVDPLFWSKSDDWDVDTDDWWWGQGDFSVTYLDKESDGPLHDRITFQYRFSGVKFVASEIASIVPPVAGAAGTAALSQPIDKGKRVDPRLWDWEPVLIELAMVADFDGLEAEFGEFAKRGSQAKLESWFQGKWIELEGDHPSEGEIRKRAQAVIAALRRRQ